MRLAGLAALLTVALFAAPAAAQPVDRPATTSDDAGVIRVGRTGQSAGAFSVEFSRAVFDPAQGLVDLPPTASLDQAQGAVTAVWGVLGRDDVFADSMASGPLLAGAALHHVPGGPDGTLTDDIANELVRALDPGSTVYLAGGTDAVSPEVESATAGLGFIPVRLGGATRTATAALIAREAVRVWGAPERVYLATATDWPEPAAAGALAAEDGSPLLLTAADELAPEAASFLTEFGGPAEVIVVGGSRAVSESVLASAGGDVRVGGATRAETAALLAGRWPSDRDGAALAGTCDGGWVQAIAGATVLQPLLLADAGNDGLPRATADALAGRPGPLFVLGGEDCVSRPAAAQAVEEARGPAPGSGAPTDPGTAPPTGDPTSAPTGGGSATPPPPTPRPPGAASPQPPSPGSEVPAPSVVVSVGRLSGPSRIETAVEVSRAGFEPGVAEVFVATAGAFADALAAGPAAALAQAPILLTGSDALPPATRAELVRLGPDRIVVLGGPAAVSTGVEADLAGLAQVARLGGADRLETAVRISAARFAAGVDEVAVATAADFPDALSGGPAVARSQGPLLLVPSDDVPEVVAAELRRLAPGRITVLGGPAAIGDGVLAELDAFDRQAIRRLSGGDRIATAAAVSAAVFEQADEVFVATAGNFPDALTAGPLAALRGSPVLLVTLDAVPPATAAELRRLAPERVTVVGGPSVVSEEVERALAPASTGG